MQQQQEDATNTSQEIRNSFYGAYPEWDTEEFKPLAVVVAEKVLLEKNTTKWDAGIQLEVAKQMRELTGTTGKAAPVKPKAKGKGKESSSKTRQRSRKRGKRPPKTNKTGARRNSRAPQGSSAGNSVDDIRALLTS